MRKLAGVLPQLFGEQTVALAAALVALRRQWEKVVGPMMAQRSEPVRIEPGKEGDLLVVAVSHAAIGGHLRILRRDLLRRCRRVAKRPLVRLRIEVRADAGLAQKPPPPVRRVSLQQRKEMARALAGVRDRKLKRALFRAWLAQLRYAQ